MTPNNYESETTNVSCNQDSGYGSSQLSFNDSDVSLLNVSESLQDTTTINSVVDETILWDTKLDEAAELRIKKWSEYVTPLLSQAKSRSNYDIQKYGMDIISQFDEIDSKSSFQSIMKNKRADFTARNFLSMLMLANTENIKITNLNKDINKASLPVEVGITLLSKEMFYETNFDMENIPKRVKKSFTEKDAPLLNILPLGDNPIEKSLKICSYMKKDEDEFHLYVDSETRKRGLQRKLNFIYFFFFIRGFTFRKVSYTLNFFFFHL